MSSITFGVGQPMRQILRNAVGVVEICGVVPVAEGHTQQPKATTVRVHATQAEPVSDLIIVTRMAMEMQIRIDVMKKIVGVVP